MGKRVAIAIVVAREGFHHNWGKGRQGISPISIEYLALHWHIWWRPVQYVKYRISLKSNHIFQIFILTDNVFYIKSWIYGEWPANQI